TWRRSRLRAVGSCGLARSAKRDTRNGRRTRDRHAWLHRANGAMVARAGLRSGRIPNAVRRRHRRSRCGRQRRTGSGEPAMKRFAALYTALDGTTSTHDKLEALTTYFSAAQPEDAAWASYFLAGGKPRQSVPTRLLIEIARERAGLPLWLFDESHDAVGDLAETIAHILPPAQHTSELGLTQWIEQRVLTLRGAPPEELRTRLLSYWDELDWGGRFLLTKLIGGGFRVGVARQLVVRALAEVAGIDHKRIAQRMVGWTDSHQKPDAARYLRLIAPDATGEGARTGEHAHEPHGDSDLGLPYPFFLAHPLQNDPATLGDPSQWLIEWKWDGIRAQLVKRGARLWLWSRGEDLITDRFPEVAALGDALPDGYVIDGEILAWEPGGAAPLPFARL